MDFLKVLSYESMGIGIYFFIFFGKILEVSASVIRNVLINRGERTKGTVLGFFEIILWVVVTGTVLVGFIEDPIKIVVFCFAFATGIFMGSKLEALLAFGMTTMEVIVSDESVYNDVLAHLRKHQIAVTTVLGEGLQGSKWILKLHIMRNKMAKTVKAIKQISDKCVISITDLKSIHGGFIKK